MAQHLTALAVTPVNTQTGTAYTLKASDNGNIVTCGSGSATSVTVPQDSFADFPIGSEVTVVQLGAGLVTIVAGSGATLRSNPTAKSLGQYAVLRLRKVLANTWFVSGDKAAS